MRKEQERTRVTRDKILKAARNNFVKKGFAGSSIDSIARAAQVNKSLIFHHFSSKKQLWTMVKETLIAEATEKAPSIPSMDLPFEEFLTNLIVNTYKFFLKESDIMQLVHWQCVEGLDSFAAFTTNEMAESWLKSFEHYIESGELRSDCDPQSLCALILHLCMSAPRRRSKIIRNAGGMEVYIDFIVDTILQAWT